VKTLSAVKAFSKKRINFAKVKIFLGGELACPAHNQLFAEKSFDREKIESYFQR